MLGRLKTVLFIIPIITIAATSKGQNHVFKIRKAPLLTYSVFADGYDDHDLEDKTSIYENFPQRLYIQVYDNDTFLIRWCDWELTEAASKLDYFYRDSLTFVGAVKRQGEKDIKLIFPFNNQFVHMFTISEEPLIQQKVYTVGEGEEKQKRVSFYFEYNGNSILLGDELEEKVASNEAIQDALQLSARMKLGFYSEKIYQNESDNENLPFNIVKTYPLKFILQNSKNCNEKLFWRGVTTTKQINTNDTASFNKDQKFIKSISKDNLVNLSNGSVEYYISRRYIYFENDSQLVVSNLNNGCEIFLDSLHQNNWIKDAPYWQNKDGINNYLIQVSPDYWGYASKYGCSVTWLMYKAKTIKKLIKKSPTNIFRKLNKMEPVSQNLLSNTCESGT